MDLASIEVREKLDLLTLPEDADKPVILRFDPSDSVDPEFVPPPPVRAPKE